MKKSILIFAALIAATFANAQITLEHTFEQNALFSGRLPKGGESTRIYGDCGVIYNPLSKTVDIYDPYTCSLIGSANYKSYESHTDIYIIAKNYFTTNDEVVLLRTIEEENANQKHLYLLYLDGTILQDLGSCSFVGSSDNQTYIFQLSNGDYKLAVYVDGKTRIYSLPGNGKAININQVSAPRNNARKYLHNDQVLIDNNNKTYTIQGQEVKKRLID